MTAVTDEVLSFDEAMEKYDPVLGFEVHVELNTRTKMFSSAPNAFGDVPNTNVTPVDLGLPGVLPVVNGVAVESAIKIGLALNCRIAEKCYFARKNYFYPDTPKNFQTSQFEDPIAYDGHLDIELADGTVFRVEIERAHMEEDAGKLTHMGGSRSSRSPSRARAPVRPSSRRPTWLRSARSSRTSVCPTPGWSAATCAAMPTSPCVPTAGRGSARGLRRRT
jgi:hypothetical protein